MITIEAQGCNGQGHYCTRELCICSTQSEANIKLRKLRFKYLNKNRSAKRVVILETLLTFNDMLETTSEVELWDL